MFKIPKVNVIESDEGFAVEVLGITGLLYTEGSKKLRVNSEVITGPAGICIWRDSIKVWDVPNEEESISESERNTIVENIRRAFRFRGFEIDVM